MDDSGMVRVEYYGPRSGAVTYVGKSGRQYRFGNNTLERFADMPAGDAEMFVNMEFFRVVRRAQPVTAPVEAVAVEEAKPVEKEETVNPEPEPVAEAVVEEKPKRKRTRKAK